MSITTRRPTGAKAFPFVRLIPATLIGVLGIYAGAGGDPHTFAALIAVAGSLYLGHLFGFGFGQRFACATMAFLAIALIYPKPLTPEQQLAIDAASDARAREKAKEEAGRAERVSDPAPGTPGTHKLLRGELGCKWEVHSRLRDYMSQGDWDAHADLEWRAKKAGLCVEFNRNDKVFISESGLVTREDGPEPIKAIGL
jgi:hypothetical protein